MSADVLIVDALSVGAGRRKSSRDAIGCGPRAVAGVLEKNNITCRIVRAENLLAKPTRMRGFKHLAISAMTMDFPTVKQITKVWRNFHRKGIVIIGGPIAVDPIPLLNKISPDIVVIGEGEATLDELLSSDMLDEKIDLSSIKGVAYKKSGSPMVTPKRPFISEDILSNQYVPSTVRIVDYPAYQASKVYVEVIRGCSNFQRTKLPLSDGNICSECGNCDSADPNERLECPDDIPPGCGFCSVPNTWGFPRSRSKEAIVSEIKDLLDMGVHRIVLEAPGFLDYKRGSSPLTSACSPPANLEAISELLESIMVLSPMKDGLAHLSIENMKACLFSEEVASLISSLMPSTSPNIGLETGSEQHMKNIGKCGSPSEVIRAVKLARSYGMTPFVYLIYGLPGENEDTVKESLEIMRRADAAGAERIILYGFRALPGSAFAGYPSARASNPLSNVLREEAAKINRERKTTYVGKRILGVAAEASWDRHGYTMIYPLGEGPIMTVEGGYSPGTLLTVHVKEVLSPGLVGGTVELDPEK
ncbi:MAG: B12-binding domain-containing radical SAM protein [Candidatus Thorarchaeota archaeon]